MENKSIEKDNYELIQQNVLQERQGERDIYNLLVELDTHFKNVFLDKQNYQPKGQDQQSKNSLNKDQFMKNILNAYNLIDRNLSKIEDKSSEVDANKKQGKNSLKEINNQTYNDIKSGLNNDQKILVKKKNEFEKNKRRQIEDLKQEFSHKQAQELMFNSSQQSFFNTNNKMNTSLNETNHHNQLPPKTPNKSLKGSQSTNALSSRHSRAQLPKMDSQQLGFSTNSNTNDLFAESIGTSDNGNIELELNQQQQTRNFVKKTKQSVVVKSNKDLFFYK